MKLFRRYVSRECPPEVLDGLLDLVGEYPDCWSTIHDTYIFYALNGRDKAQLTMDWVDRCRAACDEHREFTAKLERAFR